MMQIIIGTIISDILTFNTFVVNTSLYTGYKVNDAVFIVLNCP